MQNVNQIEIKMPRKWLSKIYLEIDWTKQYVVGMSIERTRGIKFVIDELPSAA